MSRSSHRPVQQGRTGRWLERLTRFGYFTRATVFTLVGLVAMRAAWGIGQATGTRGVMREMRRQPFGKTLLLATSIGMACYVLWRFVQVVLDPFMKGDGAHSSIRRIGYFGSGLFYALLSVTAAQLAFNFAGGRSFRREVVVWALAMPYGSWVVGFAGVVLFFVGSHALCRAYRASYMQLYPPPTPETARRQRFARFFGRVGLISMGLTLWIVGALIIMAAVYANPDQAIGIGGALTVLQRGPYGALLLVAAAGAALLGRPDAAQTPASGPPYTHAEVERAEAQAEWALALVADLTRETGRAVREDVLRARVAAPVQEALAAPDLDAPPPRADSLRSDR